MPSKKRKEMKDNPKIDKRKEKQREKKRIEKEREDEKKASLARAVPLTTTPLT